MITIKFRGKHTKAGEWIYGSLLIAQDGCCNIYDGLLFHKVKAETVGQFSTLRDKNGKKIYAGDIIRAGKEKTLLEVRFVRGVFAFLWNGDLDDEFPCNAPTQEWAEVVGNIHDNPKMIKRK